MSAIRHCRAKYSPAAAMRGYAWRSRNGRSMTEVSSEWPAPAKLNLFLHIIGRRADGYHLLQTVFQLLDWGDTVRLRVCGDGAISRAAVLPGVSAENDLTLRAANLLRERAG